jgi:putative FmdB family regulatory protein
MPNYEYRCLNCNRKFEIFYSYSDYDKQKPVCPHCKSNKVQRRIGRVRFARSEESRLDDLADPAKLEALEDDPKALARMMRQMSGELGEDLGPEFDEVVDRLEAGQSPEEVEEALPDLGANMGGGMGGGFGDEFD